jgi:hypothetical protein
VLEVRNVDARLHVARKRAIASVTVAYGPGPSVSANAGDEAIDD